MAKRRSVPKGVRFDVMNRDNFMCRYCGRRPPEVKLVVDHLIAVANGGTNEFANLVTSCDPCNAGKSDKIIQERAIPSVSPESEAALRESIDRQLRMLRMHSISRELNDRICQAVIDVWADAFNATRRTSGSSTWWEDPDCDFPERGHIIGMVERYGLECVTEAIRKASVQHDRSPLNKNATPYIYGILRNMIDAKDALVESWAE